MVIEALGENGTVIFAWAVLLVFVLALAASALLIPRVILLSYRRRLFDYADARKIHSGNVPRLGGLVFVPCILFAPAVCYALSIFVLGGGSPAFFMTPTLPLSLLALLLLYLEGVSDDLLSLRYKTKFLVQFLSAGLLVASGLWVKNLEGLFGVYELSPWVGMPLSVMLIVLVVNAMNLIDGIDGLASGIVIIGSLFLGCLFFRANAIASTLLAFSTLGALIPFFGYNMFGKAGGRKIFMGDCGSQTIGFLLIAMVLRYSQLPAGGATGFRYPLVVAFSIVMVPCFDVVRVMWGRMRRGQNPFTPDKTHIHHRFLALGLKQHTALVIILTLVLFFVVLGVALSDWVNINLILLIDVALWCLLQGWLSLELKRRGHSGVGRRKVPRP